jgi:AraC-like DNA-binding protein
LDGRSHFFGQEWTDSKANALKGGPMSSNTAAHIREWTTTKIAQGEQFSYFDGVICQKIMNLELDRRREGAFRATLKNCPMGSFAINQISADEHVVDLTSAGISCSSTHCFKFHVQKSSVAKVFQHGCENLLMPGDAILIDCLYPFRLDFPETFDCCSIKIPRAYLRPLLKNPRIAATTPIRSRSPLGKAINLYIHFLLNISERPLADVQMQMFIENLMALIASGTSAQADAREVENRGRTEHKLLRIKRYILNNLEDSELSPTTVAKHYSISVSYLHKLFAKEEETFGNYLREKRLEFAALSLKNQSNDHRTITELVYQCGFNDLSHFWRLFRGRYGMTPRKFRNPAGHSQIQ